LENYISQGNVATQLRCGGIFRKPLCYKFSTECACAGEKNVENRSIFGEDMDKSLRLTFLGHPVQQHALRAVKQVACCISGDRQTDRRTNRRIDGQMDTSMRTGVLTRPLYLVSCC